MKDQVLCVDYFVLEVDDRPGTGSDLGKKLAKEGVNLLAMLAFQMFENVGMTMGIMPVTGIPLPLVSYGGSSIIATLACIGLVANVGMRRFT